MVHQGPAEYRVGAFSSDLRAIFRRFARALLKQFQAISGNFGGGPKPTKNQF